MSNALTRLAETQPSRDQFDGLFVFLSSFGAVVREMPEVRPAFLGAFDRALRQHLEGHEYPPSTHEFAALLRETLEELIAEMDVYAGRPH